MGRGKKNCGTCFRSAGRSKPIFLEGVPRNGGLGADDCERPLREGAHRNQPPAILWFLSERSERNIASPRPAGRNPPNTKKRPRRNDPTGAVSIRKRIYTSFTTPTNRVTPWLRSTNRKGRFRFITQVSSGGAPAPMPNMVTAAASTPSSFTLTRVICWAWFR